MTKRNIRSMRFSDEILEMIESQAGETFTAKFEALVTRCIWELPNKEKQLAEIRKQIENEQKSLRKIRERKQKLENYLWQMENATSNLKYNMDRIIKDLEEM